MHTMRTTVTRVSLSSNQERGYYVTLENDWSVFVPSDVCSEMPKDGETVELVTRRADSSGEVLSIEIGGRVYKRTPFVPAGVSPGRQQQGVFLSLDDATALARWSRSNLTGYGPLFSEAMEVARRVAAMLGDRPVSPRGDTSPERVSDGAILDAVRAAVLDLLGDRELSVDAGLTDPRRVRWAEHVAAVACPRERDPR